MKQRAAEVWLNQTSLRKLSPVLLWIQVCCVVITLATSAIRPYIEFFWTPIVFGAIALGSFAVRYYVDRRGGKLTSQDHTNRIEAVAKARLEGDLQLDSQITPVRTAFEPRTVTHVQRDTVLSILLKDENSSPKPKIELILPPNDAEARAFAGDLAKLLSEAGYRKSDDPMIQARAALKPHPDDPGSRRLPHLFGVFSSDDGSVPDATLPGQFGSIKIFHAVPDLIKKGDTTHPQAFRHTTNVNDILYGLCEVLRHAGFRVGRISGHGILRKGQIGFYIPSQLD